MYLLQLNGWPEGEDECILEFPVEMIRGLEITTATAWLATRYYQHRQGGIMVFSGPEPGRRYISLDSRWCKFEGVVNGIRAIS